MENRCIQDTKMLGDMDFCWKWGVFLGKGILKGRRKAFWMLVKKDKKKRPMLSDAVAIFVVYDVLYFYMNGSYSRTYTVTFLTPQLYASETLFTHTSSLLPLMAPPVSAATATP